MEVRDQLLATVIYVIPLGKVPRVEISKKNSWTFWPLKLRPLHCLRNWGTFAWCHSIIFQKTILKNNLAGNFVVSNKIENSRRVWNLLTVCFCILCFIVGEAVLLQKYIPPQKMVIMCRGGFYGRHSCRQFYICMKILLGDFGCVVILIIVMWRNWCC